MAAEGGHPEVVRVLIETGASPTEETRVRTGHTARFITQDTPRGKLQDTQSEHYRTQRQ